MKLGPVRVGTWGLWAIIALAVVPSYARDAAFMDPTVAAAGQVEEAIKIEPKNDIDLGETGLNVAKRVTLFFANVTSVPVHVDKMTLNNDGNVVADISNDDCSKQGTLTAQSRCTVELSITPTSPGPWTAEVLMTHNGAGRIARAKLSGKTSGAADQKKDNGLTLNNKDSGSINFGDVSVGGGKVVRSALMTNDSPDPLSIFSIDVIEADNGLTRLDQGCAVDMELKPGESCPVTLVWTPNAQGQISTDLIIRHSGRMGFAVIPIRGTTRADSSSSARNDEGRTARSESHSTSNVTPQDNIQFTRPAPSMPMPPSAAELARAIKDVPAVSADSLSKPIYTGKNVRLIGTVGNRAVLIKPDGTTAVASAGDNVDIGEKDIKVTAVNAKSIDIIDGGKKKTLVLEAAQELIDRAVTRVKSSQQGMAGSSSDGSMPMNGISPPLSNGGK